MERILHVIAQYPGKTGSGIFLQSLVREARASNNIQAVIAAVTSKLERVDFEDNTLSFYPVEFNSDKINFNIVGMSDIMPYESTKYSELNDDMFDIWKKQFLNTIDIALKEFKPTIIISHHLWIVTSLIANIKKDIKLIVLSQGTELRQLSLAPRFKNFVVSSCKNADLICALTDFQKHEIKSNYNISADKIKVMGVGYSSDIFHPGVSVKKVRRIVYVGKLSLSKGVNSLIRSFKNIKDKSVELCIIGSGSEDEVLRKCALEDGRIKFLGQLRQEKVADILRESEMFILPSFYEGLPLVIMEALACETKVIVSEINGIKPWVGENINSSGAITYIKLPRLHIDVPYEEDLKEFEFRIEKAIMDNLDKKVDFKNIIESIEDRSWNKYFERLSTEF